MIFFLDCKPVETNSSKYLNRKSSSHYGS